MEEPPLYHVNPAVQPQPQQQLHRVEEQQHMGSNNFGRLYPGKFYEGSEAANSGAGYMSGAIEKPPPLIRNREDPSPGRYYSGNQQQPQRVPMQQSQDNMGYNNVNGKQGAHLNRSSASGR